MGLGFFDRAFGRVFWMLEFLVGVVLVFGRVGQGGWFTFGVEGVLLGADVVLGFRA